MRPPGIGRARWVLRGLARALALLLVLALAALAVVLHDLDGRVRAALMAQAADLEQVIGRAVTIGAVHVAVGSTSEIVVSEVMIAGAPGVTGSLAEPLLRIPTIRLGVRLGPLVRSWGSAIEVTRFDVEGPELTLVRTADGLSTDDVRARLAALPPRSRPPPTSRTRIALDRVELSAAKLHLRSGEGAPAGALDVEPITIRGVDVRPDAASRFTLGAAIAPGATLDATLDLALPEGAAAGAAAALAKVEIHGAGVRVAPILAWLRVPAAPSIDLADAELRVDVVIAPGPIGSVLGKASLARARLAAIGASGERELGAPLDLSLGLDAMVNAERGSLLARSFDLAAFGALAHGTIEAHALGGAPVIDALQLDASGDAGALVALLPDVVRPRQLTVAGPFTIALRGGDGPDAAQGTVKLDLHEIRALAADTTGLTLPGAPAAITLAAAITFTKASRAIHVAEARLHVGDLVFEGEATAHDLATDPAIDGLSIKASGPLDHLLDLVPPAHRRPGVTLRGPASATLTLEGKHSDLTGRITVDLDRASVHVPGLQKPAGARLGVDLEGHLAAISELTRGSLRVGPLTLGARGKVWSADHLDLAFDWTEAALAPLLALFPDAAARLAGATVEGLVKGSGTLQRGGGKTEIATTLRLRGALLRRGVFALLGAPSVMVAVATTGDKVSARISADLGAATVAVAPVFSKAAGRPARLAVAVTREGDHLSVLDAQLALPGATLDGLTIDVAPHHAHVVVAAATLALAPMGEMIPLLGALVPPKLAGATARFSLDFSGDPDDLASAAVHVGALEIQSGLGRVVGSVDFDGLRPTRAVHVQITDGALDLGALDGSQEPTFEAPGDLAMTGSVHLDSVRARGATLHPVDAELGLEHGRLTVKSLHAGALGGSVDVEKSWVDLTSAPEIDLHARVDAIDLAKIGASAETELRGRATGRVDLHGAGDGSDAIVRSLRGSARLALHDVHARHAFTRKVTVVNPLLGEIFAREAKKSAGRIRGLDLREASALFDVGSKGLTTTDPIVVRSDDLAVSLRGTIGFDQALALDGRLELAARAVAAATDGALVPVRPIPVQLRIVGGPKGLEIEVLELAESVRALAGSIRNGLAGGTGPPLP